jgi:hypothetical protein
MGEKPSTDVDRDRLMSCMSRHRLLAV